MAEIRLHGVDIEFDHDDELCFHMDKDTRFFYFNVKETIELRDFLNAQIAASTNDRAGETTK